MARTVDSLGVQKQLNVLFEQRLGTEQKILDTMQQELKVAMQLQAVMNGLKADELTERLQEGQKAFDGLAEKAGQTGDIGADAMKKISDGSKEATKETSVVSKAFSGIANVLKGILSAAAGVAGSMFKIGKAVLSIPLSIFKNLLNDAASFAGDTSFAEALEAIRKDFGSFKEDVSKNILGAYQSVNSSLQQMTGLSVWQVFGTPADQLKYLHEIAGKAGAQMHQFGGEIAKSGGAIAAFDKGMGVGAENLRAFMDRATVMGTDLQSQLKDTANYALQMGKAFGMSSKTLSKDVASMMKDVKNFGSLTQKEMTVAAVYTKKLGLEVKDLTGLVGQFDNFDKAAESAALLSQAFGASVDAFKLMNEQDPAKRLDDLRKSMAATGKTTENMTRQELKLLAQTSGLSEEAAKLAFSTKNQGLSYDQVQKQANKAENAQVTQAEALKKLADNIERVVRAGGQMHGSFFKMFFAGMEQGVKWSNSYHGAMMKVRGALQETFMAGRGFGKWFADEKSLGFSKFMTNFGETFSPKNARKVLHGFKDETGKQFTGVVDNLKLALTGKQSFDQAFKSMRETFSKSIDPKTLRGMIDGGKDMMRMLAKGIGSGAQFIVKELTRILKFLTNPKEAMEQAKAAGGEGASFGLELVDTIKKSFGDPKVLGELKTAAFDLLKKLANKLKDAINSPEVRNLAMEVGGPLIGAMLGKQALSMAPGIISKFAPMLVRAISAGGAGGALAAAGGIALAGAALVNVNKKLDQFENSIDKRRDPASKKMGAYGASMLQGLTLGLIPDDIAVMIGNKIAELGDTIFDAIKDKMGGPFTAKLKGLFGAHINFLSSIGGLIGAIFSGDSSQIAEAAAKMGDNFVTLVSTAFEFLITEMPKLFIKVVATIDKIIGGLLEGLGTAIVRVGDKIGFFGGGIKAVGYVIVGLGGILSGFGKAFEKFYDKIKEFDLSRTMSAQWDGFKYALADAAEYMLTKIPGPILMLLGISSKGREEMLANLAKSKADITAHIRSQAEEAVKAQKEAEERAKLTAVDVAAQAAKSAPANPTSAAASSDASVKALEDFNAKIQAPAQHAMDITAGVTKSINELNDILGDGSKGAMQIGAKLKRFADSSGLGQNGTYEIKNKGIVLKLDLKVTMDAGEVEKAVVLRKESIIFDAIEGITSLSNEHANQLNQIKALKGGG